MEQFLLEHMLADAVNQPNICRIRVSGAKRSQSACEFEMPYLLNKAWIWITSLFPQFCKLRYNWCVSDARMAASPNSFMSFVSFFMIAHDKTGISSCVLRVCPALETRLLLQWKPDEIIQSTLIKYNHTFNFLSLRHVVQIGECFVHRVHWPPMPTVRIIIRDNIFPLGNLCV